MYNFYNINLTVFLFLVIFPIMSFSFSETELESLESEGKKTFSKNPWRRDFGLSLMRNLELEARHESFSTAEERERSELNKSNLFCAPDSKNSLCDLSSLYYKLDWTLYYSAANWEGKYLNYSFLKNTEFFLTGSFISNFSGGNCSHLEKHDNLKDYVKCGIGDILAGWTAPVYKKGNFFSYFNFSMIAWPLSQKSKDADLKTAVEGSISALYFLKKQKKWSQAISSSHSLAYNHFESPATDKEEWNNYNNPFTSKQALNLIFKQSFNKYLPSNIALSVAYSIAINTENTYWILDEVEKTEKDTQFLHPFNNTLDHFNHIPPGYKKHLETVLKKCPLKTKLGSVIACGNRYQHLSLGASSSWKLDKRMYLNLSVMWKDLINLHNPIDQTVEEKKYLSFDLNKWYFSLKVSYSF